MKTAIITGAATGIGAAIARTFAAAGHAVILHHHSHAQAANKLQRDITEAGGQAEIFAADLTTEPGAKSLIDFTFTKRGPPTTLINNAGLSPMRPLATIDATHIDTIFALNVRALLLTTKHAAAAFPAQGGAIINISSTWAAAPEPNASAYSASKAAVNAITISLARELGPAGIRVNAIAPGLIMTQRTTQEIPPAALPAIAAATPLRRLGHPMDIANLALYLASENAAWITGQVITASGGK